MWKVTVEEYHRSAGDSIDYDEFFDSKEEALEYADTLNDTNCTIWLEECQPLDNGEWTWGGDDSKVTCLQEIEYW